MLPELPFGRLTTAPTERFFTSNVILWPRLGLEADLKKKRRRRFRFWLKVLAGVEQHQKGNEVFERKYVQPSVSNFYRIPPDPLLRLNSALHSSRFRFDSGTLDKDFQDGEA